MTVGNPGFGFYFEKAGLSQHIGPKDPSIEHFTGSNPERSVVREMLQNAIDARQSTDTSVEVVFDLRSISTSEIPDVARLRYQLRRAIEASARMQGREVLEEARRLLTQERVQILRIGDYGTKGLEGTEALDDFSSPLSKLTRGSGASEDDGQRGGSFGIGARAALAVSGARTVFYCSKAADKPETVTGGVARFASFRDEKEEWRTAYGVFTDLEDTSNFHYPRGFHPFPQFPEREALGTDVYVVGYELDPQDSLREIQRECVRNFMVAIARGRLTIKCLYPDQEWSLDASSLQKLLEQDGVLSREMLPFFTALAKNAPIIQHSQRLGEMRLYLNIDEDLPEPLGVQCMREPLMRVHEYKPRFATPYAGIFICDNERGNKELRKIEPASHERWLKSGRNGNQYIVENVVHDFIRESIRNEIPKRYSEILEVNGLERFLPAEISGAGPENKGIGGIHSSDGEPDTQETAIELGKPERKSIFDRGNHLGERYAVPQPATATQDGAFEGVRGERSGGTSEQKREAGSKKTNVDPAPGRSRLNAGLIELRSFYDKNDRSTVLVVRSSRAQRGDLALVGLGRGDNEVFDLPIKKVFLVTPGGNIPLMAEGSTIQSVDLTSKEPARIRVQFEGQARYRIGVRDA